ncbi:DNA-directed DNA polymerase delta subunit POL31 [Aspergillus saccharolyticus JOP 1030-1]|uniref:DNA-directed DNA polymerase n=1 Tax=Aspergillus saccharolyticus JOP 1030-1 TaxID=1450539 RepID=A0A318ZTU7_9EURO|nr:DNA polymerase delta subunit 2 [Aspergillus saccharolyticus JOP 1030-1]PYH47410.1 DNA polymerase delta subunit 2 [Aspergillus saccharolyticus JOP 1030-1]
MTTNTSENQFLRPPSDQEFEPVYRESSYYNPLDTFRLPSGQDRHYQQQYGDMYFLRLAKLKPAVEEIAVEAWEGFSIAGEHARRVERVLDVRQGELCWVAGTIYMDMPLKPNILDDLTKENYTLAPPPRPTYQDPSHPELTQIMLEDESGRLRLTGSTLSSTQLATGAIIAVLGTENANGDFEVIDTKVPDLPRQPHRWERDEVPSTQKESSKGKIAFVSGLSITGTSSDTLALELLTDYLLGYTGSSSPEQDDDLPPNPSAITRLVIAGNSLGINMTNDASAESAAAKKKSGTKKYGYDASAYNASPITQLDSFLAEILPSIPVTLMSGETDPANFSLPQQGIHRAMFPRARAYCAPPPTGDAKQEPGWFDSVTNPWEGDVEGWRLWGSSGQNVDDVLRYLNFSGNEGNGASTDGDIDARVRIMEAMLRWRCGVPTAPDTIWSYPFQTHDPFVIEACPHIFFAGNQPRFKTAVIEGDMPLKLNGADTEMTGTDNSNSGPRVRLLSIPKFKETGELVLVDVQTLEVEVVKFGAFAGQEDKK